MSTEDVRLADEAIYLDEDRYQKPKEVFRLLGDMIESEARNAPCRVLDIGCATGELIYYLSTRFPTFEFVGIDVVETLIDRARRQMPEATFMAGSILDETLFTERAYDIVICNGVLGIFDDIDIPVGNLLSGLRDTGTLYISNPFNDNPIDVRTLYRPSDDNAGPWQRGWNIHSKSTLERFLEAHQHKLSWKWEPFKMPYALEKKKDPMRAWTISTEKDPHQRINGACQLLKVSTIQIRFDEIVS